MLSALSIDPSATAPSGSPAPDPTQPRPLLALRLQVAALQQGIAVRVPFAAREIIAEHGGGRLRLVGDAEREVALRQPVQRLRNVGRRDRKSTRLNSSH